MRHSILALAAALAIGTAQVCADQMVTYNMTGTITSVVPYNGCSPSFAAGDQISWTLQYDTSTPMYSSSGTFVSSALNTPLITNLIDHTTGSGFFVPSFSVPSYLWEASAGADLNLSSTLLNGPSSFMVNQNAFATVGSASMYSSGFALNVNGSLPSLNLASLQLNKLPLA